jgi:hypothetical protein
MRVEPFEVLHGAQTERRGGVPEAEHVRRHVHDHRAVRWMIARHIGKKAAHDGLECTREELNKTCALRQPHHAQPERHDSNEAEGQGRCRLRGTERAL